MFKRYSLVALVLVPVVVFAQNNIEQFLKGQPVIDMHFHITKGDTSNKLYSNDTTDVDIAKLKWIIDDYKKNNVVLALGGGNLKYTTLYSEYDSLFWAGIIFPCSRIVDQDKPCEKEFYSEDELRTIYKLGRFKSMGESMFNYYGILPSDERLSPYWKIASEFDIPIGVHSDTGPKPERVNQRERPDYNPDFANPAYLKPILEKYPNLRIYLMHYGGGYSKQALDLMKEYPQIYCEMSAVVMFAPKEVWEPNIKKLFAEGLGDRLMFGSDYFGTVRKNIEIIYKIDWLTAQQKRNILYNNAARFLKLSGKEIKDHHDQVK